MGFQRLVWRFNSSFPIVKIEHPFSPPPSTAAATNYPFIPKEMSLSLRSTAADNSTLPTSTRRKLPILLFDIMDTIVRDPFYHDVPSFFGMSMKELLECKHPTAWIQFEKGLIDEMELARIFFKDGRTIDLEGLKSCMRRGYSYIEGVERLLIDLKKHGYEMHTSTNYPIWYEIIEEKLKLSNYLSWTFCSCIMGKRKPDPDFYLDILEQLKIEPSCCIFIDDRMRNVEAAVDAGFVGIQFKDVELLRKDLSHVPEVPEETDDKAVEEPETNLPANESLDHQKELREKGEEVTTILDTEEVKSPTTAVLENEEKITGAADKEMAKDEGLLNQNSNASLIDAAAVNCQKEFLRK